MFGTSNRNAKRNAGTFSIFAALLMGGFIVGATNACQPAPIDGDQYGDQQCGQRQAPYKRTRTTRRGGDQNIHDEIPLLAALTLRGTDRTAPDLRQRYSNPSMQHNRAAWTCHGTAATIPSG